MAEAENTKLLQSDKHKMAGRSVAEEFELAAREIHLKIKHRGTVTTWSARQARQKNNGSR